MEEKSIREQVERDREMVNVCLSLSLQGIALTLFNLMVIKIK